jgi:predicted RNase H-like HicB family nuclease
MADNMKPYTVIYERDEHGWWVASVRGVKGVHSQGRGIEQARERVREALALAIGDEAAERTELVDDVRIPKGARKLIRDLEAARRREERASSQARRLATQTVRVLTKRLRLSRRDIAALTGYSFQRIHQIAEAED